MINAVQQISDMIDEVLRQMPDDQKVAIRIARGQLEMFIAPSAAIHTHMSNSTVAVAHSNLYKVLYETIKEFIPSLLGIFELPEAERPSPYTQFMNTVTGEHSGYSSPNGAIAAAAKALVDALCEAGGSRDLAHLWNNAMTDIFRDDLDIDSVVSQLWPNVLASIRNVLMESDEESDDESRHVAAK